MYADIEHCPLGIFEFSDDDDDDRIEISGRYHKNEMTEEMIMRMNSSNVKWIFVGLLLTKQEYERRCMIPQGKRFVIYEDSSFEIK